MAKLTKADLQGDKRNANSGSTRGAAAVAESLARYGAGRSILVDKSGRIIAGNTTAEHWEGDIEVVESDGSKLVVVQRTDLDLYADREARELAHADNRTSQLGYTANVELIDADMTAGADLAWLWRGDELEALRGVEMASPGGEAPIIDFDKVPRNSGFELVVVLNSEDELREAREAIQDLGYFTK